MNQVVRSDSTLGAGTSAKVDPPGGGRPPHAPHTAGGIVHAAQGWMKVVILSYFIRRRRIFTIILSGSSTKSGFYCIDKKKTILN